jgi:hypothetical protein
MRAELRDELRDIYYSEHADQDLRDWCFDSLCDDNKFLERSINVSMDTNERWEAWAVPIALAMLFMMGVATCAIALC